MKRTSAPTSTVGRGKAVTLPSSPSAPRWSDGIASLSHGDSLQLYEQWETPTAIVSDGAYGILGFEGDTSDHLGMPDWYEPHIRQWSARATAQTTLWFWNSEIGWATVHPVLERYGWRYMNANVWSKGKAHIAGKINSSTIRRFPVVTELCVQYAYTPGVNGLELKQWLLREWKRTGLTLRAANQACDVADVAVRKYLDQGHLWYFPPPDMFAKLAAYANRHGDKKGRPYFSRDGVEPMSRDEWARMRTLFRCPIGWTNVWERHPLKGAERIKVPSISGRAAHLNQKPLDLMRLIIEASTNPNDVVWEPFGGLFSASFAARQLGRRAYSAELDSTYFQLGVSRFQHGLFDLMP